MTEDRAARLGHRLAAGWPSLRLIASNAILPPATRLLETIREVRCSTTIWESHQDRARGCGIRTGAPTLGAMLRPRLRLRHPRPIVAGVTRIQSRGGPLRTMTPGDTVWIAPDEEHWHGAAPASLTVHLAVYEAETDGTTTVWLEQVTEADYTASAEDD